MNLIMERKAFSDFRWTAVEDIVAAGGCLYRLPLKGKDGYLQYFQELDVGASRNGSFLGPAPGRRNGLSQSLCHYRSTFWQYPDSGRT